MEKKSFNFEDLEIWKEGMRLSVTVYKLTKNCNDYSFKDQIRRASVSVPSNISEGFERQTNKEFIQFLYIAKGSCAEVRTQTYLAKEFGYLNQDDYKVLMEYCKFLSSKIQSFINSRKNLSK
ncbi:MAG: four helix bundle protein [Dysgonamonadaceae bacterium]|jgi:four helix bundle protein|nr:four helix bundle protein [Dysgonamonadaceae bacterium]